MPPNRSKSMTELDEKSKLETPPEADETTTEEAAPATAPEAEPEVKSEIAGMLGIFGRPPLTPEQLAEAKTRLQELSKLVLELRKRLPGVAITADEVILDTIGHVRDAYPEIAIPDLIDYVVDVLTPAEQVATGVRLPKAVQAALAVSSEAAAGAEVKRFHGVIVKEALVPDTYHTKGVPDQAKIDNALNADPDLRIKGVMRAEN